MTREEVVKWLESLKREIGKAENRTLWHYAESIDMAIKALKENNRSDSLVRDEVDVCKERESKLDLISRQDAISEIDAWIQLATDNEADMAIKEFLSFLKERIESLPSAEPKTGEWIDRSDGGRIKYPWWESCKCNQCGEYGSGAYNFCPNCGARMRGEEE